MGFTCLHRRTYTHARALSHKIIIIHFALQKIIGERRERLRDAREQRQQSPRPLTFSLGAYATSLSAEQYRAMEDQMVTICEYIYPDILARRMSRNLPAYL